MSVVVVVRSLNASLHRSLTRVATPSGRVAAEFKKHHELCFRALLVTETFVLVWVYGIIFRLDGYVHSGGTEPWLCLLYTSPSPRDRG